MMRGLTSRGNPTRMCLFKLWTVMSFWLFLPVTSSVKGRTRERWLVTSMLVAVVCGVLIVGGALLNAGGFGSGGVVAAETLATPSRSTTIALTSDETRLVVVNREANSVSIIQSERREMTWTSADKLAEIPVGLEPRCVAVNPNDRGGVCHQRHQRHRLGR